MAAVSSNQLWVLLTDDNKGCRLFRGGFLERFVGGLGVVGKVLASQPGVVQCTTTAIFSQNESICRGMGAFAGQNCGANANSESMGLNLYMPFHQDNLKSPTLQPSQPEGITH